MILWIFIEVWLGIAMILIASYVITTAVREILRERKKSIEPEKD